MAELAVDALRESLKELWLYHANSIDNSKEQVEMIESHLHRIKAFLRDPAVRQRSHQELLRHIRDVVYEAEDIIDAYSMQVSERKSTNFLRKALSKSINLHDVCQNLQSVSDQIATNSNNATNDDDLIHQRLHEITQPIWIRGNNVVSLEDEIEKVIEYLNEDCKELDVVAIVGMPGIGKTTLARQTFHNEKIMFEFPIRIWIHVSNDFIEKDVFLAILKNFTQITDDMNHKSGKELAELAAVYLEKEKFLIVMDDVWSPHDWDRLLIALPKSNNKGRVLITSCNEKVGLHANKTRVPHKVRFLTQTESWSLLKSEVFGDQECPHELENIGRLIAEQCEGLPLAILAMASTLVEEELSSSDMRERIIAWTKAGFRVPQYRNSIFYHSLPDHLRYCFLYFGMFPYDFEIPVWELIRMWIAEGFIHQNGGLSVEETAETYLDDLISRNLVTVCRIKSDGKAKTCRIHRMLHEFCKIEGGNGREDFLQEIKFSDGVFELEVSQLPNYRRLCIHSNVLRFLSSKPFGPRVRSFVCFCKEDIILPAEYSSVIPQAFKLLRVLDANHIKFLKIPSDMYHLLHLRYLVLSISFSILPRAFAKLSKLQTLVVNTTSRTLEYKGDILVFTELRHLKTNASTILARPGKSKTSINHVQQLQTLGTIFPESCTKELLEGARNLKKLGIRGRLSVFFNGDTGSFDSLAKLENLEILKLMNDVFPKPTSQGRLHSLPSAYKFPPRLRSLTLASTFLDWSQMNILGSLKRLTVLKLKDNAFVGRNWVTHDLGFDSLEILHIERTDLVVWVASAHHFPRLRRLQLHYCEQLREVPIQLADIHTLQHLELFNSKLAAASAHKIGEEIIKQRMEFKLSVFPNQ